MPHLIYRGGSRGKPKVTRWKAACETHSVYWLQIEKGMELGAQIRKEPGDATIAARGEHCLASACPNVKSGSGAGGGGDPGPASPHVAAPTVPTRSWDTAGSGEAGSHSSLQPVIRRKQAHTPQIRV